MALANELHENSKHFIIVDKDEKHIKRAKDLGYLYLKADASEYETIDNLIFKNDVEKVVVTTENDALNLSVLLTIKAEKKDVEVIVRANNNENIKKFKIAKADFVIFPYETVAEVAVEYIGSAVKFDAIENLILRRSNTTLDEINIYKAPDMIGKTLSETGLNEMSITTIAILKNGTSRNFIFNPDKDEYKFEANDSLVLLGDAKSISAIRAKISRQVT